MFAISAKAYRIFIDYAILHLYDGMTLLIPQSCHYMDFFVEVFLHHFEYVIHGQPFGMSYITGLRSHPFMTAPGFVLKARMRIMSWSENP